MKDRYKYLRDLSIEDRKKLISFKKNISPSIANTTKDILNVFDSHRNEVFSNIPGGLLQYLEKNEIPSSILFNGIGAKKYYDITHNSKCVYSAMYKLEKDMLSNIIINKSQYIHNYIVDIGCGDGEKAYHMLQKGLENKTIKGTVDYLGLDDSYEMTAFAKKIFYDKYYRSNKENIKNKYIESNDIDKIMKKVRPQFSSQRFQKIRGLDSISPKTLMFLGGTFGNIPEDARKLFLQDIKNTLQPGDSFLLSYFPILHHRNTISDIEEHLINNFFEAEKERFQNTSISYHEKSLDIIEFQKMLPGISINHDDFDISLEVNPEGTILYDVRTFNKDIYYNGYIVIDKGQKFKSSGTPIDRSSLIKDFKTIDRTKTFTEAIYQTEENDEFIKSFLISLGIDTRKIHIDKTYDPTTKKMIISILIKENFTFNWKEGMEKFSISKKAGEIIKVHESARFTDEDMINMVTQVGLNIKDTIGGYNEMAGQDVMKILVISK